MKEGWSVSGENKGKIELISIRKDGLLPKGSFLTVEDGENKYVLRVDNSSQIQTYKPSPMVIEMDMPTILAEQKCQNVLTAYRIKNITKRKDGLIPFIKPQTKARLSTQEEIDIALGIKKEDKGSLVFIASMYANQNQHLMDEEGNFITAKIPEDMFYHQTLICGKTGSGKTVALKYLAQYFIEEIGGAVLAVNVKDSDLLKMNEKSEIINETVKKEWETLKEKPHGVDNFMIYYPATSEIIHSKKINPEYCEKITLNVNNIDPESFTGILQNITDIAAQNLPNIFRYWQEEKNKNNDLKFKDFCKYFADGRIDKYLFKAMNSRNEELPEVKLNHGTYENINRNLNSASDFFDNEDSIELTAEKILQKSKMSVIEVAVKNGPQFGAILLRELLHKIIDIKTRNENDVPILIIIDEVHTFYNTNAMGNALKDLDTICRTGRSKKMSIIFASQSPSDIPSGLSDVINSKMFFKTEATQIKKMGINISTDEIENLGKGFAVVSIHDLPGVKLIKFPLSYGGVFK